MMEILKSVSTLKSPDWCVCAGFVCSKIWDTMYECGRTKLDDVNVIYFDPNNTEESVEKKYEEILDHLIRNLNWSVKNQARMHLVNYLPPYKSSIDTISKFL